MSSPPSETKRLDNDNGNNSHEGSVAVKNVDKNGNGKRGGLIHTVSIIVEPVLDDESAEDADGSSPASFGGISCCHRGKGRQSPVIILDDIDFETCTDKSVEEEIVKSIIATARLRKQEFARLLEEHAQLVNEINRVETSLL